MNDTCHWPPAHQQAMAENRCKVFYVDYDFFRQMFDTWQNWGMMALGAFTEDFRDCRVVNCFHSDEHRAFGFVLCHPGWPNCPPGERLERIPNSSNHVFCLKRVSEAFEVPEKAKALDGNRTDQIVARRMQQEDERPVLRIPPDYAQGWSFQTPKLTDQERDDLKAKLRNAFSRLTPGQMIPKPIDDMTGLPVAAFYVERESDKIQADVHRARDRFSAAGLDPNTMLPMGYDWIPSTSYLPEIMLPGSKSLCVALYDRTNKDGIREVRRVAHEDAHYWESRYSSTRINITEHQFWAVMSIAPPTAEPHPLWSAQPRPEASKCKQCRGTGNFPDIEVCGECGGSGEAK